MAPCRLHTAHGARPAVFAVAFCGCFFLPLSAAAVQLVLPQKRATIENLSERSPNGAACCGRFMQKFARKIIMVKLSW
jgi:hypothetical protein